MNKLRRIFLALLLFISLALTAQNEYKFNSQPNGFSVSGKSGSTLTISHNVNAITIESADREGLDGQFITWSGIFSANEAGAPNLPSGSTFVAIPNGSTPSINLVNAKAKTIQNVDLIPAPQPQLDDDDSPAVYQKDMRIYGRDAFYPATPYQMSETMTVRGVEMVQVGVMPFQYNPVTKELIVYEDMELELSTEGGDGNYGDLRYRTPEWDQILTDMLLNQEALPKVDYGEKLRRHYQNRETGCEYLIITPDNEEFLQLADSIKQFRTDQGIPTEVYTVTQCGGNTGTAIRNFIRNAYNTWDMPPAAVLILGDHNTDPTLGVVSFTMNNHPGGNGYNPYISDHAYSVMGNNHMPNIIMGRITGRDYDEMYHMIKKDLDYERRPPTNPSFYDEPVTAMGFQLERWFQLCSEVVNGFWEYGLEKHPVRINAIYQGTPGYQWSTYEYTNTVLSYFGPSGCDYIPNNMSHLTDWSGNAIKVNECINSGAFILQHRDHGAEELWGEPGYNIAHIHKLTNPDLTYVMSNNCLTGRFNYSGDDGCFAEAFHRHQHGALGLIAATQVSYSFVNDIYVWGVYNNMWPDFLPTYGTQHPTSFILPAFGNAAGKFFLRQSSWTDDGVKEITYYLFHQHGDAYMNLYSEVPQHLDIEMLPVLAAGSTTYQIKADEGSTICLTANGQIIGFDYATGQTQSITVTPQSVGTRVNLTVRKQNYYRYEHELATIPNDEPYLIFNSIGINDDEGNANEEADYNETCKFSVGLHNAGFSNIDHVDASLTCGHPSVQILQNEATFGTFNADDILQVEDAFTVRFGDSISDGELIRFYLQIGNGTMTFIDSVTLAVNAPELRYRDYAITDLDGEPVERLMPGTSSLITFNIANEGHSASLDLSHLLLMKAPFLNNAEKTLNMPSIAPGASAQATFRVDVDENAPAGNIIDCTIKAESGSHNAVFEPQIPMGYTIEDFDDDIINPSLGYDLGSGNKAWTIVEEEGAIGGYCVRSPSLSNRKKAYLFIEITCHQLPKVTFRHKTSTEEGDQLLFSINNKEVGAWEGETDWETSEFELKNGNNLLKFTFIKDSDGSDGEDCVWIDDLRLPPLEELIIYAGDDAEACPNTAFTPNSYACRYETLVWSTDGDGFFDDPTLEQPQYTFGENDLTNGQVKLTMTATSSLNGQQQSNDLTIQLLESLANIELMAPEGDTLVDLRLNTHSTYHVEFEEDVTYYWSLVPEEAGLLNAEGSQATVDWAEGYSGMAVLTYQVGNFCGESEPSQALNIHVMNSTGVDENNDTQFLVYPNPAKDQVRVKATGMDDGVATLRVIDVLGRVIKETKVTSGEGTFEAVLNTSSLQRGLYDIQLVSKGKMRNYRLIIL